MTEPTPPGAAPEEPSAPSYSPPPSAPPSAPPPSAPPSAPGYSAGPPPVSGNIAPQGFANNDEKTWVLVAHFGAAGLALVSGWLGWVAPLVSMMVKGNESPTVRAHAVAALNFQITMTAISIVGTILGICGSLIIIGVVFFIVPFACWILSIVFGVVAGMKANEGQFYKYPMSFNLIK